MTFELPPRFWNTLHRLSGDDRFIGSENGAQGERAPVARRRSRNASERDARCAPALARYCREPFVAPASPDEDALRAHLARHSQTLYHPVGTCAMGSGPDAVVDAELRVYGTEVHKIVNILRRTLADLEALKQTFS